MDRWVDPLLLSLLHVHSCLNCRSLDRFGELRQLLESRSLIFFNYLFALHLLGYHVHSSLLRRFSSFLPRPRRLSEVYLLAFAVCWGVSFSSLGLLEDTI